MGRERAKRAGFIVQGYPRCQMFNTWWLHTGHSSLHDKAQLWAEEGGAARGEEVEDKVESHSPLLPLYSCMSPSEQVALQVLMLLQRPTCPGRGAQSDHYFCNVTLAACPLSSPGCFSA